MSGGISDMLTIKALDAGASLDCSPYGAAFAVVQQPGVAA